MTSCSAAPDTPTSAWIAGPATLTMAVSRLAMNVPASRTARAAAPPFRSEVRMGRQPAGRGADRRFPPRSCSALGGHARRGERRAARRLPVAGHREVAVVLPDRVLERLVDVARALEVLGIAR